MTYKDILHKFGGGFYYDHKTGHLPVKNTVYGALIDRFEEDKFDIQLTCIGLKNLERILERLKDEDLC